MSGSLCHGFCLTLILGRRLSDIYPKLGEVRRIHVTRRVYNLNDSLQQTLDIKNTMGCRKMFAITRVSFFIFNAEKGSEHEELFVITENLL